MKTQTMKKETANRNGFDMEKMLVILLMACMAGLGTVLLMSGIIGIEIIKYNFMTFVGLVTGLTGIYFGGILWFQTENK